MQTIPDPQAVWIMPFHGRPGEEPLRAASLGSVNTLAGPPATTSHVECSAKERAHLGIPESLVRYSCGIEDQADLIADIGQALSKV
jgi:cystathionine gamma-synthase